MDETKTGSTSDAERRRLAAGGEPTAPPTVVGPSSVVGPSGPIGIAAIKPNVLANISPKPEPTDKPAALQALDELPDDVELVDRIVDDMDGFLDRLMRRFR
jgi:hypothetical protein